MQHYMIHWVLFQGKSKKKYFYSRMYVWLINIKLNLQSPTLIHYLFETVNTWYMPLIIYLFTS